MRTFQFENVFDVGRESGNSFQLSEKGRTCGSLTINFVHVSMTKLEVAQHLNSYLQGYDISSLIDREGWGWVERMVSPVMRKEPGGKLTWSVILLH